LAGTYVGVCRLVLGLEGNASLKGKRGVLRSVIKRTRNKFNVAMAEVEDMDVHTRGVVAFAVVGNDQRFVNSCVDKIVNFVEDLGQAPIVQSEVSIERY
jgi:uncharacterized protein YlxP (DUF503 family)